MLAFCGQFVLYCLACFFTTTWYYKPNADSVGFTIQRWEPWRTRPQRPCTMRTPNASTTGAKILVPSLPKTGTTSLQLALQDFGYRSYKMEDYVYYMTDVFLKALAKTPEERQDISELVAGFRGCKADAIFTDSLDALLPFEELYKASPGAKVIWCHRPLEDIKKSLSKFSDFMSRGMLKGNPLTAGWRVLPWLPLFRTLGFGLEERLAEGFPEILSRHPVDLTFMIWYIVQGVQTGAALLQATVELAVQMKNRPDFMDERLATLTRLVPKEDLLVFDVKKHGWKELADFLQIENHPPGDFPKARDLTKGGELIALKDVKSFRVLVFSSMAIHLVNFMLLRTVCRSVCPGCGARNRAHKVKGQ